MSDLLEVGPPARGPGLLAHASILAQRGKRRTGHDDGFLTRLTSNGGFALGHWPQPTLMGAGEKIVRVPARLRMSAGSDPGMPMRVTTGPRHFWCGQATTNITDSANRKSKLNAALHRIAITEAHYHPDAIDYLKRRRTAGDNKAESIRALKRRVSDVVFRALIADAEPATTTGQPMAA